MFWKVYILTNSWITTFNLLNTEYNTYLNWNTHIRRTFLTGVGELVSLSQDHNLVTSSSNHQNLLIPYLSSVINPIFTLKLTFLQSDSLLTSFAYIYPYKHVKTWNMSFLLRKSVIFRLKMAFFTRDFSNSSKLHFGSQNWGFRIQLIGCYQNTITLT